MIRLFTIWSLLFISACASFEKKPDPNAEYLATVSDIKTHIQWAAEFKEYGIDSLAKLFPTVVGDNFYRADEKGLVGRYELVNGRKVWEKNWGVSFSAGPKVIDDLVLLGTRDADLFALDAATGDLKWRKTVDSEVLAPPGLSHDMVVVQTIDGKVLGLTADRGDLVWTFNRNVPVLSLRGTSAPLIVEDKVIVGLSNGKVVALSVLDGKMQWESTVATARGRSELERMVDIDADLHYKDGTLYLVSFQGRIAALTIESGRILWTREMSSFLGLVVSDQNIFLSDAEGKIWALNRDTGATLWVQEKLFGRVTTTPAFTGEYVLVGDSRGDVYWLTSSDGRIVKRFRYQDLITRTGIYNFADQGEIKSAQEELMDIEDFGVVGSPIVTEHNLLVNYRSGVVAAFSLVE